MAHTGPQVIIMTTPIAHFFKCAHQDGFMWLFAVGVGAGSLLVSFLTKVLTRCACPACCIGLMKLQCKSARVARCVWQGKVQAASDVHGFILVNASSSIMLLQMFLIWLHQREPCLW